MPLLKRCRITSLLALSLLAIASLGACSRNAASSAVQGEIAVLLESKSSAAWRLRHKGDLSCTGGDATEARSGDLSSQLQLKNSSGKLIATGVVQNGTIQKISPSGACLFKFAFSSVPESDFYTLEIPPYGSLSFSERDLADNQQTLGITIAPGRQTIANDLAKVRQETQAKRKEYDTADELLVTFEDSNAKLAAAKEAADREYQKKLFCIQEQEVANFNEVDNKVLSGDCRKLLAKVGALHELIKGNPGELKYSTELTPSSALSKKSSKKH